MITSAVCTQMINVRVSFQNTTRSNSESAVSIDSHHALVLEVLNCSFRSNNRAILVSHSSEESARLYMGDCVFIGNQATGPGGALFVDQTSGQLTTVVENCV